MINYLLPLENFKLYSLRLLIFFNSNIVQLEYNYTGWLISQLILESLADWVSLTLISYIS